MSKVAITDAFFNPLPFCGIFLLHKAGCWGSIVIEQFPYNIVKHKEKFRDLLSKKIEIEKFEYLTKNTTIEII